MRGVAGSVAQHSVEASAGRRVAAGSSAERRPHPTCHAECWSGEHAPHAIPHTTKARSTVHCSAVPIGAAQYRTHPYVLQQVCDVVGLGDGDLEGVGACRPGGGGPGTCGRR